MAVSGGGAGNLEGVAALITALVVAGGFVASLFRRKDDDEDTAKAVTLAVESGMMHARQQSLETREADYDRQVARVHQLLDFIIDHGLTPPERTEQ